MNNTKESLSIELKERIEKMEKEDKLLFFNCHVHIFNFKHVHNSFLKGMIPWWIRILLLLIDILVIWLLLNVFNKSTAWIILIIFLPIFLIPLLDLSLSTLKLHSLLKNNNFRKIVKLLQKIIPSEHDFLERYANFILHSYNTVLGKVKSQKDIFSNLQSYYPVRTKFVTHTMDMDYMINCEKPQKESSYYSQIEEIKELKQDSLFANRIYPFIHADPRRLADSKQKYFELIKRYIIEDKIFLGIKIYPALGYFPFDRRLKPLYDLAIDHDLPIMSHCSMGPVYYRGKIKTLLNDGYFENGRFVHPFTGNELKGKSPRSFTPHFTHPLNYYFLMNEPDRLYEYWKICDEKTNKSLKDKRTDDYSIDDLKKYRNLKFCLGHYGGSEAWIEYLKDAWLPTVENSLLFGNKLIHESNGRWKFRDKENKIEDLKPMSWYSIISDMIMQRNSKNELVFPNLYADISYNLSNEKVLPLLKVRLETNQVLSKKILFGTDFYMVSMNATEREITIKLRSFIGEDSFRKIALINPFIFLSSKQTKTTTLLN